MYNPADHMYTMLQEVSLYIPLKKDVYAILGKRKGIGNVAIQLTYFHRLIELMISLTTMNFMMNQNLKLVFYLVAW